MVGADGAKTGGRPNRDRQLVSVWLSRTGLAIIDELAAESGVRRSDMLRELLSEAVGGRLRKRGFKSSEDYLGRNP